MHSTLQSCSGQTREAVGQSILKQLATGCDSNKQLTILVFIAISATLVYNTTIIPLVAPIIIIKPVCSGLENIMSNSLGLSYYPQLATLLFKLTNNTFFAIILMVLLI